VWHERTVIKWWNEKNTTETSQPSTTCSTVTIMTTCHSEYRTHQSIGFTVAHLTPFLAPWPTGGILPQLFSLQQSAASCCLLLHHLLWERAYAFSKLFHIVSGWNPNHLQNASSLSLTTVTLKQIQTFCNWHFLLLNIAHHIHKILYSTQ
jgi:hypothetical protein